MRSTATITSHFWQAILPNTTQPFTHAQREHDRRKPVRYNGRLRVAGCPQPPYPPDLFSGSAWQIDRRDPQAPGDTGWPLRGLAGYEFHIPVVTAGPVQQTPIAGFGQTMQDATVLPTTSWQVDFSAPAPVNATPTQLSVQQIPQAQWTGPPPPFGVPVLFIQCRNENMQATPGAWCGFTDLPAGVGATVICTRLPDQPLPAGDFVQCMLQTQRFGGTRSVTAAVHGGGSWTWSEQDATDHWQSLTLDGLIIDVVFADGFGP